MRIIRQPIGIFDRYSKGKVVNIDFTYQDHIIVWIQYKTKTVAHLFRG